ncbi:MAG: hypothetical protein WBC05_09380, partial [Sedimentisphaerales bacterium]
FSVTLTTKALNQSRLRWFATCSCKPVAGGLLPSLTLLAAAHWHYVSILTSQMLILPKSSPNKCQLFGHETRR